MSILKHAFFKCTVGVLALSQVFECNGSTSVAILNINLLKQAHSIWGGYFVRSRVTFKIDRQQLVAENPYMCTTALSFK